MAKGVVEHVGLLEVIQLVSPAYPSGRAKLALRQEGKKVVHRNQSRHNRQRPSRCGLELFGHEVYPWNLRRCKCAHLIQRLQIKLCRLARQILALPAIKKRPCSVLDVVVEGLYQWRIHGNGLFPLRYKEKRPRPR